MFLLPFNTGTPAAAPVNIRFPADDISSESFVIQWDAVMDLFTVNYTVRWYRGDNVIGMASVDELSYTVTGLTANTSYNVIVAAINTCCGAGPVSNVVMVMTNMRPPTLLYLPLLLLLHLCHPQLHPLVIYIYLLIL